MVDNDVLYVEQIKKMKARNKEELIRNFNAEYDKRVLPPDRRPKNPDRPNAVRAHFGGLTEEWVLTGEVLPRKVDK